MRGDIDFRALLWRLALGSPLVVGEAVGRRGREVGKSVGR
jgi:hypothetical protein